MMDYRTSTSSAAPPAPPVGALPASSPVLPSLPLLPPPPVPPVPPAQTPGLEAAPAFNLFTPPALGRGENCVHKKFYWTLHLLNGAPLKNGA